MMSNSFWKRRKIFKKEEMIGEVAGKLCNMAALYPQKKLIFFHLSYAFVWTHSESPGIHLHLWRCVGRVVPNQINSSRWKGQDSRKNAPQWKNSQTFGNLRKRTIKTHKLHFPTQSLEVVKTYGLFSGRFRRGGIKSNSKKNKGSLYLNS